MCRKVAGAELSALVTFAVISTTQNARGLYIESIEEAGIPAFFLYTEVGGHQGVRRISILPYFYKRKLTDLLEKGIIESNIFLSVLFRFLYR